MLKVLSVSLFFSLASILSAADQPKNVLFIVVDDLRPELGCYGKPYMKTPNIDALAANGVVFDRAYCQQAVCSPSRTSVLTGVRPDTSKVTDLVTNFRKTLPNIITLPQHFKQNGYFSQAIGKIYHGELNDPLSWSIPWNDPKATTYLPKSDTKLAYQFSATDENGNVVKDEDFSDGMVKDEAISALKKFAIDGKKFFLAVGFHKPHLPWVAPKKYWDMYDSVAIPPVPNPIAQIGAPRYAVDEANGETEIYTLFPKQRDPQLEIEIASAEVARDLRRAYYACVSYTDAMVGQVINELKRLGLDQNTIIVLWGDHGWKLGEHAAWSKHSNVENDTNAPLIISVPNMKSKGKHSKSFVEFVDIYPTLCDLAGMSKPKASPSPLEGASFKYLLDQENPDQPWKKVVFTQFPAGSNDRYMGNSMRTEDYRLTRWTDRRRQALDSVELYDQKADPDENTNIANRPENAALVQQLTKQLLAGWKAARPSAPILVTPRILPPGVVTTRGGVVKNPIYWKDVDLSVSAVDDKPETELIYHWAVEPVGAGVTFSANHSNQAKLTTASFTKVGTYVFTVTVTDADGFSAPAGVNTTVSVTVHQGLQSITVLPIIKTVPVGASTVFSAKMSDQFGNPMTEQVAWSTTGGGTINAAGEFTATNVGSFIVTGSVKTKSDTATIRVAAAATIAQAPAAVGADQANSTAMNGSPALSRAPATGANANQAAPGEAADESGGCGLGSGALGVLLLGSWAFLGLRRRRDHPA